MMQEIYNKYMNMALSLALKGTGKVSPNPRVGAVIIKNDEVVSTGWHQEFGGKHAERIAIENAEGINLEGAALIINLEPCSHFGKQPPCAPLLVEKMFGKVIVGIMDPNPLVHGEGLNLLQHNGIEVVKGVLEDECRWINRFFVKYITEKKPYVILKTAQSLNGCIATATGESKWITSEASRKKVHEIRAEVDAVIIGRDTAIKDNPDLTVRHIDGRNPYRVVFDTRLNLPWHLKMLKDEFKERTIVCCSEEMPEYKIEQFKEMTGTKVLTVSENSEKRIDVHHALTKLAEEFYISSVMVEGGAGIASSFLLSSEVDELRFFYAPKIILGGLCSFYDDKETEKLIDAPKFKIKSILKSGDDFEVICTRK